MCLKIVRWYHVKFYAGDKKDTGGRSTYTTMTFSKNGQNLPTAYMAWGMLRNKTLESLPEYCDEDAYIDDEVMRFWLNQQLFERSRSGNTYSIMRRSC